MSTAKVRIPEIGRRLRIADYLELPDDGNKYELFEGELVMSPSYDFSHGRVQMLVASKLKEFAERRGLGLVGIETDTVVPRLGTVLRPDVCFVAKSRRSIIKGHLHGPPDLAVEVTSPSNWQNDVHFKRVQYERFSVREYWVLDIAERRNRAYQWYWQRGRYVGGLLDSDRLRARVPRGFSLRLKDVWKAAAEGAP